MKKKMISFCLALAMIFSLLPVNVVFAENIVADANLVVAPEDPGSGFDLEELTIVADADLAVGTKAEMTASMEGYAPVTEVVATVSEADALDRTVTFEVDTNNYTVNDKAVSVAADTPAVFLQDGVAMIQCRGVMAILTALDENAKMSFDPDAGTVTFAYDGKTVEMTEGSDIAVVNGQNVQMQTESVIVDVGTDGFLCVPLQDLFTAFGATDWYLKDSKGGFNIGEKGSSCAIGGKGRAVFKVVDAREELKDFNGYIGGDDVPELQIKVIDINNLKDGRNETRVEVTLDGAEFKNADGTYLTDDEAMKLISFWKGGGSVVSAQKDTEGNWYFDADGETITLTIEEEIKDTLEFRLSYEGEVLEEDDIIIVQLQSMMDRVKVGKVATVSVDSNLGDVDDLVYCKIMEKLKASVKGIEDIAPEEIATLRKLRVEANVGNLPSELTLKLNEGFEFASKGIGTDFDMEIDKDDPTVATVTVSTDTSEIRISGIEIEATTADIGDVATITVKASGLNEVEVEVAEVKSSTGDTGGYVFKVIDIWERAKEFDGYIGGDDVPELQIKVRDINNLKDDRNETRVEVTLDGAEFKNADGTYLTDDEAMKLISFWKGEGSVVSAQKDTEDNWYFDVDGETITLTIEEEIKDTLVFRLSYEGEVLEEGDIIIVQLQSMMDRVKVGQVATVSVHSDLGDVDDLVYCEIMEKELTARVKKTVTIVQEEIATLRKLRVDANVGNLPSELTLKLNKGFEFVNISNINGDDFTVTAIDDTEIAVAVEDGVDQIFMDGIQIEATTAADSDVATITVRADDWVSDTAKVAVVSDGFVHMSVDEDEDIPVIYSGVAVDNGGITDDNDHYTLDVTIEEPYAGAWDMTKPFSLTLPEGVYVTDMKGKDGRIDTVGGEPYTEAFRNAYVNGDHKFYEFDGGIFQKSVDEPWEMNFALELVALPGFEGDVTLTLSGEALATREVTIAKFVKPYEVSVDTLTLRQGKNGTMNDMVITEAAPGLWGSGDFWFELYDVNNKVGFLPNNKGNVTVNVESGATVEKLDDVVGFMTLKESKDVPAVVTLSGYEVKTTGASVGNYALRLVTPGGKSLLEEKLDTNVILESLVGQDALYATVDEDAVTVYKKSSSSGGGSSKKENKTETSTTEAPKVTTEETTTVNGETTIVDTTSQTLGTVAQEDKAVYHEQLSQSSPAAEVIGDGAYTFAMTAKEPADAESVESEGTADTSAGSGTKDPEKVSFDLSGQNMEDTSQLTLVKYETQPDGTVKVIKLGGTFDPETNSFSAYTDGEGVYDLVYDPDVVKMTYTIGQTEMSMNDTAQESVAAPVIVDNRTMVPLRTIAENFGAEVVWDGETQTVHIVLGEKVLSLKVGEEVADGMGAAMIIGDRTVVPLRYIGESFDATVRWIPSTQGIEIVK